MSILSAAGCPSAVSADETNDNILKKMKHEIVESVIRQCDKHPGGHSSSINAHQPVPIQCHIQSEVKNAKGVGTIAALSNLYVARRK